MPLESQKTADRGRDGAQRNSDRRNNDVWNVGVESDGCALHLLILRSGITAERVVRKLLHDVTQPPCRDFWRVASGRQSLWHRYFADFHRAGGEAKDNYGYDPYGGEKPKQPRGKTRKCRDDCVYASP